jgi:crotonobetainyl-CoA:carnitine CoA-transferase CaiB-like acyl-CoA transferase
MGLFARQRYGKGQYLETTMLTSSGYVHSNDLVEYSGRPERLVPDHQQHGLHALYRLYRCADGWLFLGAVQEKEWVRLAKALGRSEWLTDSRFADSRTRLNYDADLADLCERLFAEGSADVWARQLGTAGVPAVSADEKTFEEFLACEGLLRPEAHPVFGDYWRLPAKVRFTESANHLAPASAPGEHTQAILEELGYTDGQRAALEADGVVLRPVDIEKATARTVR